MIPFFNVTSVAALAVVSRFWRRTLRAETVWRILYARDFHLQAFLPDDADRVIALLTASLGEHGDDIDCARQWVDAVPRLFNIRATCRLFGELPVKDTERKESELGLGWGWKTAFARPLSAEIPLLSLHDEAADSRVLEPHQRCCFGLSRNRSSCRSVETNPQSTTFVADETDLNKLAQPLLDVCIQVQDESKSIDKVAFATGQSDDTNDSLCVLLGPMANVC
jgi:hypothetical protein